MLYPRFIPSDSRWLDQFCPNWIKVQMFSRQINLITIYFSSTNNFQKILRSLCFCAIWFYEQKTRYFVFNCVHISISTCRLFFETHANLQLSVSISSNQLRIVQLNRILEIQLQMKKKMFWLVIINVQCNVAIHKLLSTFFRICGVVLPYIRKSNESWPYGGVVNENDVGS